MRYEDICQNLSFVYLGGFTSGYFSSVGSLDKYSLDAPNWCQWQPSAQAIGI